MSLGVVDNGWGSHRITKQGIDVKSNLPSTTFWETSDSKYLGIHPYPDSTNLDYSDFIQEIGETALAKMTAYEYVKDISNLYNSLVDTNDQEFYSDKIETHVNYSDRRRKASHYQWFLVDHSSSDEANITVDSWVKVNGADYWDEEDLKYGLEWTVEIWASTANKSSSGSLSTSDTQVQTDSETSAPEAKHPEEFSEEEAAQIGLEKIPADKVEKRGKELNLQEHQINDMKESEGPGYVAHDVPMEVEVDQI